MPYVHFSFGWLCNIYCLVEIHRSQNMEDWNYWSKTNWGKRSAFKSYWLTRVIDQLELYRVKDIRIEQPFFLRLVGLSNVILKTSDRTNAIVTIPAVANGKELRDILRLAVETRRNEKNVHAINLD